MQTVSLLEIAQHAARDFGVAAEKVGISLNVLKPDREIPVYADTEKMAEAISNSISNAIKHTPKGGSITLRCLAANGYGVVEVEDTGEGMSPETLQKLFTRDQILGGNATAERSSGLGLYIAQKFMSLQNGDVSARSIQGKGSTFVYRIPLAGGENIEQ